MFSRSFLLLWHGQVVSQLGNQAFLIAAAYLALDATRSTSIVAAVMMASAIPLVVLGPLAGTFADRHSRRGIVMTTDLLRSLAIGVLAAFIWMRPGPTATHVTLLLVVAACNGAMAALFTPAVHAFIPDVVEGERLASANSLTQFSNQAAMMVGQALGGVLYVGYGPTGLLAFDAVSFAYAACATWLIEIPRSAMTRNPALTVSESLKGYWADTAAGMSYVRAQPGLLAMLLTFGAVNFLFMPVFVLLPLYVRISLGVGPEWYGFLLAGSGAGALVGAATTGLVLTGRRTDVRTLAVCIAIIGVAILAVAETEAAAAALAAFVVIGLASAVVNVVVITHFQTHVPAELRGRVMGLVVTLSTTAAPLGMAIGGVMGDVFRGSLRAVFAGCGIATMVVAINCVGIRRTPPHGRERPD